MNDLFQRVGLRKEELILDELERIIEQWRFNGDRKAFVSRNFRDSIACYLASWYGSTRIS
jgi:hypothetical protein